MTNFEQKHARQQAMKTTKRPIIRTALRSLGDVPGDHGFRIVSQAERDRLLEPAKKRASILKVAFDDLVEHRLMDGVYAAFDNFLSNWRSFMTADYEKGYEALECIDHALAKLISNVEFHSYGDADEDEVDYDAPFNDEESAFEWLQGSVYQEHDNYQPEEFFDSSRLDREIHHLWLARTYLVKTLDDIHGAMELEEDFTLTPRIYTHSRLDRDLQDLVYHLCKAWSNFDPELGMQRTGEGRQNPLLRFVLAAVAIAAGDDCAAGKKIENFIKAYVRDDFAHRQKEEPELPFPAGGDPFSDDDNVWNFPGPEDR